MAKPHKFAWNGLDVETGLSVEQVANLAQRAAQESTGDLTHGKHRIASVRSSERQIEFRINDYSVTFKKFMVFHLDFESRGGRTWMSSRIDWYVTTQPRVGKFIPVGFKTMVGHHTYLQFVRNLAEQIRAADPNARVTLREGVAGATTSDRARLPEAAAARPAEPEVFDLPAIPPPPAAAPRPGPVLRPPPPPPLGRTVPPPPPAPRPGAPTDASAGLVTGVPGMPARGLTPPAVAEQAPRFASAAEQLFAEDDSLFHTQLVQRSESALPWQIRFADGGQRAFAAAMVLGRNPVPPPGVVATPVALDDPHRSVSKTHALLELRDGMPWLTDLHSTNGTTVTNEVGEAMVCEAGVALPLGDGWTAGLGEFDLVLQRTHGSATRAESRSVRS